MGTDQNGSVRTSVDPISSNKLLRRLPWRAMAIRSDPLSSVPSVVRAFALLHVLRSLHALHVSCFSETIPRAESCWLPSASHRRGLASPDRHDPRLRAGFPEA